MNKWYFFYTTDRHKRRQLIRAASRNLAFNLVSIGPRNKLKMYPSRYELNELEQISIAESGSTDKAAEVVEIYKEYNENTAPALRAKRAFKHVFGRDPDIEGSETLVTKAIVDMAVT